MFQHTFYPINSLSASLPLFTTSLFEPKWPLSGALCLLVTHIHSTTGSCPVHTTVSNHWPESTFVSAMLKGTSNMVIKEGGKCEFTTQQDRHTCYFPESDGNKVHICTAGQHLSYFQVLMFQKISFFFFFFLNSLPHLANPSLLRFWQAITRLLLWSCLSLGTSKGPVLGKNNICARLTHKSASYR